MHGDSTLNGATAKCGSRLNVYYGLQAADVSNQAWVQSLDAVQAEVAEIQSGSHHTRCLFFMLALAQTYLAV